MEPVILPVPTSDFMFKKLLPILLTILIAGAVVVGLYMHVTSSGVLSGFTRNIANPLLKPRTIILDAGAYYIAGASRNHVWLGTRGSSRIQLLDVELKKWRELNFDTKNFSLPEITIDSPEYYIQQVAGNRIQHGLMDIDTDSQTLNEQTLVIDAVPVSATRVILKTTHPSDHTFVLAVQERGKLQSPTHLLEKQLDGRFCTDGIMRTNPERDRIIYVYYYRNEFVCTDTALNLLYRANTIDTISQARISVAHVSSERSISLSSPARVVNQNAQVSEDRIYIESKMVADNEAPDIFDKYHVIDVYALTDGAYQFSFYLPRKGKQQLEYRIKQNRLFLLSHTELSWYELILPVP